MKSVLLLFLISIATIVGNKSARCDLITTASVVSSGEANARSGANVNSWSQTAFGDYAASASFADYTASASASLVRALNSLEISASANANAGTAAGTTSGSFADSYNDIYFTTSTALVFHLTGSVNDAGGGTTAVGLMGPGGLVLSVGESKTLDSGSYQFFGYAIATDVSTGGGNSSATLSASLNVSAVPEPNGLLVFSLGALGFSFRRKRP